MSSAAEDVKIYKSSITGLIGHILQNDALRGLLCTWSLNGGTILPASESQGDLGTNTPKSWCSESVVLPE